MMVGRSLNCPTATGASLKCVRTAYSTKRGPGLVQSSDSRKKFHKTTSKPFADTWYLLNGQFGVEFLETREKFLRNSKNQFQQTTLPTTARCHTAIKSKHWCQLHQVAWQTPLAEPFVRPHPSACPIWSFGDVGSPAFLVRTHIIGQ